MLENGSKKPVNRRWWLEKGDDLSREVFANYRLLADQAPNSSDRYVDFMSLYMNRYLRSDSISDYMKELCKVGDEGYRRVKFNLVKLVCDTVVNRIGKMQPRARFLPTGGNASLHRRAKLLERVADALVEITGLYRVAPLVFLDALIFGMGCLRPYRVGGKIKIDRVYPGELFVDPVEAAYDNVRQLFHRKFIAREVVEYEYVDAQLAAGAISAKKASKLRAAIRDAPVVQSEDGFFGHNLSADPIEVVEAWHLPSGEHATDGKYVVSMDGEVLYEEEYKRECFPMCFVRWSPEPRGFFGIGVVEEIAGIHIDVNNTLRRIEQGLELNASPYVFVERGSKVKKAHVTNTPGLILEYQGQMPAVQTVNAVPPEYFNYLNNQVERAFRSARLNMPSSGSKLPASLQTGAAWREYHDTDREDFAVVMKEFERFFMDVIKQFIYLCKEAWEEDNSFSLVASKDKYTVESVNWKDVDMEEDAYALRVYPASSLPTSIAGRLDAVMEMFNAGWIGPDVAMKLVDVADIEQFQDLESAEQDQLERQIELILDEGVPQSIDVGDDPQLALKTIQAHYKKALGNKVPEDRLVLLRQLKQQCVEIILQQQQEAMAMQQQATQVPVNDGSGVNPLANQQGY